MPFLLHHPAVALWLLWPVWAATWMIAALWASPAKRRPGTAAERRAVVLVVLGFVLLFVEPPGLAPFGRLWRAPATLSWAMVALTAAGFALCWWARLHLGRLWSFQTTTKADHRIVDTGPYAFARHPIYSGILVAALARAAQAGGPLALAGFAVLATAFWLKAGVEETFLARELGPDAYGAYAGRVRRLVPFLF
jgi:protein-S-isoprenylcysteine O-methyltransferase Ste14